MSKSTEPRTPHEVIEHIRSHAYLLDVTGESERVREGAESLRRALNRALKLLSEDLYSKKSHFVLELVQNADDNHYEPDVVPRLSFNIAPERLVVVNNEVGFTEGNVRAICDVGSSSKAGKKYGYIGEKGIGFKSVFVVSDSPEVHSNGYHFRFDRKNEGNLLGYVVPQWCAAPPEAVPDHTTIVLPAAEDCEFSDQTLAGLDAKLLLFLHKLRELSVEQAGRRISYCRRDVLGLSHLTTRTGTELSETTEELRYLRAETAFSTSEVPDEKRPDIGESTVVLAFPVDEGGAAMPDPTSEVFAFLPIRPVGFKFAIQADFILSSSREAILTDRPWNKFLREAIAQAFVKAVDSFKETEALAFTFLKYLPTEGEVSDPFFRPVGSEILEVLRDTECLPSASGQWSRPSELRLAGGRIRDLFPSATALELFGFDYLDERVQGAHKLLQDLGTQVVAPSDILTVFRDHSQWLMQQPLEWKAKFYGYLADSSQELIAAGLLKCACLPTAAGRFVVPATTNVFFPLSRGKRYGFEEALVFIDSELFEQAQPHSTRVWDLLEKFEVRSDDPYDLVMSHILPRHQGESWKTAGHKALIGHLRYIKDKQKLYLERAAEHGKSEAQAFQLLREGIWVGTKRRDDQGWIFNRASGLYLGKEYKPDFCIESMLGDALSKENIVSEAYLAEKSKDSEADAASWREFLGRLGIRFSPGLEPVGTDWRCSEELQQLLNSSQAAVRRATLECLDQYWSKYGDKLTHSSSPSRSSANQRDTGFALSLRATLAPTKKKAAPRLDEAFYPTAELQEILGNNLPYIDATLSEPMLEACRVTYKLDAKALVKRLRQLKTDGTDTARQLQGIYRSLERLWDTDATYIRQAFDADALIRTKGAHKAWSAPEDVSWRANGPFLDSIYPPLEGQYRDFHGFFLNKLQVPRELPTAKRVDALTELYKVEDLDARRKEALAIYLRANRDLAQRRRKDWEDHPDWLATFEYGAVLINHRDELVVNDEMLFADDVPDLAALFSDYEEISFLGVPSDEVPRLSRLLDAAGVKRLSSSVHVEVIDTDDVCVDGDLTARVQGAMQFVARILYARHQDSFDRALSEGLFAQLRTLQVAHTPALRQSVKLGDVVRERDADIAQRAGCILYRTGAKVIKDRVSSEVCRFLGAPDDFADIVARVLMEQDESGCEDFLKARGIGELPADLQDALERTEPVLDAESDNSNYGTSDVGGQESTTLGPHVASAGEASSEQIVAPFQNEAKEPPLSDGMPAVSSAPQPQTLPSVEPSSESDWPSLHKFRRNGSTRQSRNGLPRKSRINSGRLLSYAAAPSESDSQNSNEDPTKAAARDATARAAVEYFMLTQRTRWKSLTEMPHNNPGFDVRAVAHDDVEEFIEVKGQSAAWTECGVALTPMELATAQQKSDRYWLCVVEHVHDEKRRRLHLLRNPYGLTQRFMFDSGWKSAAIGVEAVPLRPEKNLLVEMPGLGRGRILSVRAKGKFFNLHVILEDGSQVNKLFNPATMTLSAE